MAAADYTALVQELYISYFGRPADPRGLENFSKALDAIHAPTDIDALVTALASPAGQNTAVKTLINTSFSNSDEAKALYNNADNLAFVGQIYKNVLNRVGDADGLIYWANKLDNHELSRENAAIAIMQGALANDTAQGLKDAALVNAKVAIATNFTTGIDTGEELLAYSGNAAAATARDMLGKVTSTTDATAFQATVDATLQGLVNSANPGQTYNLTQGLDTITGTSANDKINAFAFNATTGADTTTLNSVDTIDGGAGTDTLFIEVKGAAAFNANLVGKVSNVENIIIDNTGNTGAAPAVDASKFEGATNVTQVTKAGAVTNLGSTTTATFQGTAQALSVASASGTANVALDAVAETSTLGVTAETLNLSGTVDDTNGNGAVPALATTMTIGKDKQTVTVNSGVDAAVTLVENGGSTKHVTTFDASASSGSITFAGDVNASTIKGGSGDDDLTLHTTTNKTNGINAVVSGGAGDDSITVTTTGDGTTNVDGGAGDDTVTVTTRGTGKLTVNLGDGTDTFTSAVAVNADDVIDAGAGSDTLALTLVGASNIGAFAGFDLFDVAGLAKTLDVDILATKNTVTEFVGSDILAGNSTLTNIGANVGFRATGDMGTASTLTLTQKSAGALTVTMDADQGAEAAGDDVASAKVVATNATSLSAVFDTSYANKAGSKTGETAATDNVTTLNLTGSAATTLSVTSGGTNSQNVLVYDAATKATAITVTGAQHLDLTVNNVGTKLTSIDASASTGGLSVSTASVSDTGTIKLGSGVDTVTVAASSAGSTGFESVANFEKAAAAAVGSDATAKAAAQADADTLFFAATRGVADAGDFTAGGVTGSVNAKGVLVFSGAGPADLAAALAVADAAANGAGEVVAFEYLGNTFVFDGDSNAVVKLVGVTGVTQLGETTGGDHFFVV
ncbi:DUF4214 domain-containing protein [Massilia arenosa]|uniref:DUF4214 domain-containing protein n=1 Tax=Zemynaea arenosa TaxID=2561931 RepID=A0A4Y9STW2_9BURK|nr:DUF4214 domain-containing protein [Massilia arenosa]TFW30242.1 DUF4214 domain-containing protein [Massilia arenosa]